MAVNCNDFQESLEATRSLLAPQRNDEAVGWLREYLAGYDGAVFDRVIDHDHPDEFTQNDFDALPNLGKVRIVRSAQAWLLEDGQAEVKALLADIERNLDIWDLAESDFDSVLGTSSPAWRLWKLIEGLQQQGNAGHAGTGVTAGKLLHGKRPRLIPIYDEKAIKPTLHVTSDNVWEAFWCILRHDDVRHRLGEIQQSVPEAAQLSTLRVLDIIAWMSVNSSGGRFDQN